MTASGPATAVNGRSEAGFTLVEMLAALSILAMTMVLVAGSIRTMSETWSRHTVDIDRQDTIRRGVDLFRRDLRSMQRPVMMGEAREGRVLPFVADSEGFSFVGLAPAYPTSPGPEVIRYAIERGAQGDRLLRFRAAFDAASRAGPPGGEPVALIEGPVRLRLSYGDREGNTLVWRDAWLSQVAMPRLVRLDISGAAGAGVIYPPVVASVRAEAEQFCIRFTTPPCSIGAARRASARRN